MEYQPRRDGGVTALPAAGAAQWLLERLR